MPTERKITTAMAAVSIIDATFGGSAAAYAAVAFRKVLLGCVLLTAAGKTAFARSDFKLSIVLFVALHMVGTKRTYREKRAISAFRGKPDIEPTSLNGVSPP
jgi:hypothetical protein